jgi:hypothetical protein
VIIWTKWSKLQNLWAEYQVERWGWKKKKGWKPLSPQKKLVQDSERNEENEEMKKMDTQFQQNKDK